MTVSKFLSNVIMTTFFIHNSKEFFEIIVQSQFFTFNVSMITAAKTFFDRTTFAIIDVLLNMIPGCFFYLIFFQRRFENRFKNEWCEFWRKFFVKRECFIKIIKTTRWLKRIYFNIFINCEFDFWILFWRLKSNFFVERWRWWQNINNDSEFRKCIKKTIIVICDAFLMIFCLRKLFAYIFQFFVEILLFMLISRSECDLQSFTIFRILKHVIFLFT